MPNEVLFFLSIILYFGGVLLFRYLFGLKGLYVWTAIAAISANIEVMILINAFHMDQTLGNVMFASSFLVTDIISENYGKKEANTAVSIGIFTSLMFIFISKMWLIFTPAPADWAMPHIKAIFSNTPRITCVSFLVYAISQRFDVWAYHKWWNYTEKKFKNKDKYLWLRNNGSTLVSQLINTILFTFFAFYKVFPNEALIEVFESTYIIYIVTSLLDTPAVYLARKIKPRDE